MYWPNIGLTAIAAVAFLICYPIGKHILSEDHFSEWLADFSEGLTIGTLLAEILILIPAVKKLRDKMNELISQLF